VATNWVVLKFGGTSVSGLVQWDTIATLLQQRVSDGNRVLLVCSAVAGITDELTALAEEPQSEDRLIRILQRHHKLASDLQVDTSEWLETAESMLRCCVASVSSDGGHAARAELLAMGEWLSTRIGARFLKRFMDAEWVDAREALEVLEEPDLSPARQWLSARCKPGADPGLRQRWEQLATVLVTQGFVASTAGGKTALLGRGGSDTSAALLAGRLCAERAEIWTDVPGLFSADPHLVPVARLLTELNYDEALEMAASGARVVHPECIRMAAATGTPVVIRDSARPHLDGTRISKETGSLSGKCYQGVKAITCQKGMEVLLLQNTDTRREVGFLARVFDIFRRYGISIDLVATSETTTTVSVNGPENHLNERILDALVTELQTQCTVRRFCECVCINLVGAGARTALSRLQSTLLFFDDHPLLLLSQSANDLCLSMLIESRDYEKLLSDAHSVLIPGEGGQPGGAFGPRWIDMRQES